MKLIKTKKIKNFIDLYKLYLKSFPIYERKPFLFILLKYFRKTTEILSIVDNNNEFLGLIISVLKDNLVLVAYFAISTSKRGSGVGSIALNLLKNAITIKKFFLKLKIQK